MRLGNVTTITGKACPYIVRFFDFYMGREGYPALITMRIAGKETDLQIFPPRTGTSIGFTREQCIEIRDTFAAAVEATK